MEYCIAMGKNRSQIISKTWANLKNRLLSERSQVQEGLCSSPLNYSTKAENIHLYCQGNGHRWGRGLVTERKDNEISGILAIFCLLFYISVLI